MLLLLAAGRPAEEFDGGRLGAQGSGRRRAARSGRRPAKASAISIALHTSGLREPLPIASKCSFEYAAARRKGAAPDEAVKAAAEERGRAAGGAVSRQEPEHEHVYGKQPAFACAARTALPQPGDGAEQWPDEPTRFGVLSRRWWDPMLEGEFRARG